MKKAVKRPELTPRQRRLLERVAKGAGPRASHREFQALLALDPRLRGNLQMESALGADTSAGYIITPLIRHALTEEACRAVLGGERRTVFNSGTERFEDVVTGRPTEHLSIEIVETATGKVEKKLGPYTSTRLRDRADAGLNRQLNHDRYYTRFTR